MAVGIRNLLLLLVVLIVVCLPRFDREDELVQGAVGSGMANDSAQYIAMTDIFSGKTPAAQPWAPFTYRPLVPYLASLLPLPSMTAINVLNVGALWVALGLLGSQLLAIGLPLRASMVLLLSFTISFPVFYYGAIGYVDPVAIAALGAACFCIQRQQDTLLLLLIAVGTLAKETVVLAIPVFMLHGMINGRGVTRTVMMTIALVAAFVAASKLARALSIDQQPFAWTPSWDRTLTNLTRLRTWLSFVLSFGLPGTLATAAVLHVLFTKNWRLLAEMLPWIAGVGGAVALFGYSIISAYSDGRFIWPADVFALPLVAVFVAHHLRQPTGRLFSWLVKLRLATA